MSSESEDGIDESSPERPVTRSRRRKPARKVQFRWNETKDLALVTEVANLRPFASNAPTHTWKKIGKIVGDKFKSVVDSVGAQRRFALLLKDFKKEDFKNRYKSGTEEDVTEIKIKLADLQSLIEDTSKESEAKSADKQKKLDSEKALGEEIRGAATTTLIKRKADDEILSSESTPKSSRRLSDSSLIALWTEKRQSDEKKVHADHEIKQMELKLQERKLNLEEEKFNHQKEKEKEELELKKQQLDIEKEEKRSQINTQKLLMEMLLKKL